MSLRVFANTRDSERTLLSIKYLSPSYASRFRALLAQYTTEQFPLPQCDLIRQESRESARLVLRFSDSKAFGTPDPKPDFEGLVDSDPTNQRIKFQSPIPIAAGRFRTTRWYRYRTCQPFGAIEVRNRRR